ncbi:protein DETOXIFICATION 24-like isoform X1 [Bidens hawaiensis]|uniref:protein DETOXIFICATION 24-like isoform X1 n=1 Tax=Bidens hawaiensis TaxID=980011 RepID=UPI0040495F78
MDNGVETKLLRHEEEQEGALQQRVWDESKKIWRVALPGIIARVSSFGTIVITQSFIGHVSSADLAGYALVQTLTVRFINGTLLGMSSATETLCGQSFGAGQHHMMGIHLQRSWIVDLVTVTILLPLLIFGTQIFKLFGEEASIAESGGFISLWFIPYVYNYVFSLTIQMYLQAQLKNFIVAWLSAIQLVFHILLSLLFVYKFNWGVSGAMLALGISSWAVVFGEFIYVLGGWCPDSWKGFTVAAFKDLLPVVKLSISSGVMLCLELWYYAILVLLAGYMPNAEVAISAFSISLNINSWEFMISLGFLSAACVRVANEVGRGNSKAVKFSIKVVMGISATIGVFFFVLCLVFREFIAYLFTDDDRVAYAVSDLSLLLSFSVLLNGIYPVLSGVAIGAGMQTTVAIVNLVCFYLIGIPLGVLLGYLTPLQVKGIWIGMIGGVVAQTITLTYMIWRTNWDDEVKKASERLMRFYVKTDENAEQISS